jgi:asparagine synthase (glutamine-hydrolysing)
VLSPACRDALNGYETRSLIARHLSDCGDRDSVNRMLYADTKLWLPDYLLLRGDKLTMAHSLEARVPLLDHKLVEFAASLPPSLKVRGRVRKYLLKRVAGRFLPHEIVHRRKEGFPMPLAEWLRGGARELVHDMLSPASIRRRGLFDGDNVQKLVVEHDTRRADHSDHLWGILSIEMWCRSFVDGARVAGRAPCAPLLT